MPIAALAAAIRRSAAAISGRRSSKLDGSPAGISGRAGSPGAGAMLSSDGGLPISAAIAFSSWPRWIATAIARARVLSTVVRACATSAAETRPALYWFWVIRSDSA